MALPEISAYVQDYLRAAQLADKDRLLRALRRMVEQADPAIGNNLPEGLGALQSRLAPELTTEGAALLQLLRGYYLAAAFRHQEAAPYFEQVGKAIPETPDPALTTSPAGPDWARPSV